MDRRAVGGDRRADRRADRRSDRGYLCAYKCRPPASAPDSRPGMVGPRHHGVSPNRLTLSLPVSLCRPIGLTLSLPVHYVALSA